MSRTLQSDGAWRLRTVDQTLLPFEWRDIALTSAESCREAIVAMRVRGAPLIGAVGAYGLAFALREDPSDAALAAAIARLASARPTAVNLAWALERVRRHAIVLEPSQRATAAWQEAERLCDEDARCNLGIGELGAPLLRAAARGEPTLQRPLQVLTHCNAGRLATIDHGTALAPLYALHAAGVPIHVWVDETRPRNQGASLTAWELARAGVPHTVLADNAGGLLMMRGEVDVAITGCDRVAANGDVANKIGTYLKALAAADNQVPFYVACPISTLDTSTVDGAAIEIEYRSAREVTHARGRLPDGAIAEVALMDESVRALNPGFDITPARLVTALITERGVVAANREAIADIVAGRGARTPGAREHTRPEDRR
jgi:methylthioribose-1-phosphate isomerase